MLTAGACASCSAVEAAPPSCSFSSTPHRWSFLIVSQPSRNVYLLLFICPRLLDHLDLTSTFIAFDTATSSHPISFSTLLREHADLLS
jgi:hypothetical protein